MYWVTQKLPQIYTANHATIPKRIREITAQICGNFWVTQYIRFVKDGQIHGIYIYIIPWSDPDEWKCMAVLN